MYILPILYKIARYCTELLNIACCYTSCYKLYILPILLKIAQNCSISLKNACCSILLQLLKIACFFNACCFNASMISLPLTVLLSSGYEIITMINWPPPRHPRHLSSTSCTEFSTGSTSTGSTSHQPMWSTNR